MKRWENNMKECVLFDANGKEIDWYDPIRYEDDVEESATELIINHANGIKYTIPKTEYVSYIVREKLVEIEIDLPDDLYAAMEKLSKELKITKEEFIIKAMKEFLSEGE
jgi:hypothetical protein